MKHLALLTLLFPLPAFAIPTTIAGSVLNGTTGKPAIGAQVQLIRPAINTQKNAMLARTRAGSDGRYRFPKLNISPDDLLLARVEWGGYAYDNIAFVNKQHGAQLGLSANPDNVAVQVFDGTDKPIPITATVHHVAIKTEGDKLKCIERYVFDNPTKKTYIGTGKEKVTIRLSLPEGAANVKLDDSIRGAKLVKTSEGWAVSKPLLPSVYDRNALIVNYDLRWPLSLPWNRAINLSRQLIYPVNFFFIAREESDKNLQITAPQLGADETTEIPIDNQPEQRIVNPIGSPQAPAPALQAGTLVEMRVARPINPLVWAFVVFVGALCGLVPLALSGGKRRQKRLKESVGTNPAYGRATTGEPALSESVYRGMPGPGLAVSTAGAGTDSVRLLIEQIAQLDDEHEAGRVEINAYQAQRAAWKNELLSQMQEASMQEASRFALRENG